MSKSVQSSAPLSNLRIHDPDKHALFMHYVQTTDNGSEFVICCECKHWIERPVDNCKCKIDCHAIARLAMYTRK